MVNNFKASLKNGELIIHPFTKRDTNGNLEVHVLDPATEAKA